MTTDTITQDRPVAVIETPKRFGLPRLFCFLALLCDGADLGFLALSNWLKGRVSPHGSTGWYFRQFDFTRIGYRRLVWWLGM